MTITVTTAFSGPYTAAADDTFAVTFQSASETEIQVTLDGVEISPAGYVFTRDEDGTGEVVLNVPVTGEVMIISAPDLGQPTEFLRHGAFYPDLMNAPLDRLAAQIIYLDYLIATAVGDPGEDGADGLSAYEVAVANGFVGTEADWLLSLEGTDGVDGVDGDDAVNPNYTYAINTLTPGSSATLTPSGTYPNILLTFGIPRGDPGASGALGDGTYSGIIVSGTGSNLDVVAGHITLARMANLAANSVIANITGAPAVPAAVGKADLITWLALATANIAGLDAALAALAPTASPALTGNPTAPTQSWGTNNTRIATTAYADRMRDLPLIRATASPTAALTDIGGVVEATSSAALPANASVAFPVGSMVVFYNNSNAAISLTITTDTLRLAGTTSTGTRTIAPRGYAFCRKRATTEWTVSGDVS